jgi:hypothetical protein
MGKLLIERVPEIAEIVAANHGYFACHEPDLETKRRHEGLQEIKEKLAALLRRSAA